MAGAFAAAAQRLTPPRPRSASRMTLAASAKAAPGPAGLAERLSASDTQRIQELFSRVSTLVLDCDGVLWRGSKLFSGTVEALLHFRSLGLRLLFLTNNSSKSRAQYMSKFAALGIQAAPEEIVPSSFTAAAALRSLRCERRALVLGTEGLAHEMDAAGVDYVTWSDLVASSSDDDGGGVAALESRWTAEGFGSLQLDPSIGAVVVGWDPEFSYSKLCVASALLRQPGSHFIATNLDSADNIGNGRMMPGTGCIVRSIETASDRVALDAGKGGPFLLPFLCEEFGIRPEEAMIVGDRLDTDIALGRQGGFLTVLPLTGVTTEADLGGAGAAELPDVVVPNLAALAGIHAECA